MVFGKVFPYFFFFLKLYFCAVFLSVFKGILLYEHKGFRKTVGEEVGNLEMMTYNPSFHLVFISMVKGSCITSVIGLIHIILQLKSLPKTLEKHDNKKEI